MNVLPNRQAGSASRVTSGRGSLRGLMALYEHNYVYCKRLIPDIRELSGQYVSRCANDLDLHLAIVEQTPYTTVFKLTYWFVDDNGVQSEADPDLTVRMFHDARQAETLSCKNGSHVSLLAQFHTASASQLERRWERNQMLNKWLGYLLSQGHSLALDALKAEAEADAEVATWVRALSRR